jgi:hypothetical protein
MVAIPHHCGIITPSNQKGNEMTKRQIYHVRGQVHGAMHEANNSKATYSLLIRMEWKMYGYVPVTALNAK